MTAHLVDQLDAALHDVPIHPNAWVPLRYETAIALRSELERLTALDGLFEDVAAIADRYAGHRRRPGPPPTPNLLPPQAGEGQGGVAPAIDLRARCIDELQRLATNGIAPTRAEWNERRQELPDYRTMLDILNTSWNDLVAEAGLRRNSGRAGKRATLGAEIERHIAAGAEPVDDSERYATHLEASAARTVVRDGKLPTGEPVRVTATHYMLR